MSRTILLADDSSTIQRIVELAFADDAELRVVAASSGSEALQLLTQLQPDLLLADVVMPEPAGYELCRRVKGSDRPIPVALLAGTFEPFDQQMAADSGADDFLVKPFETERLRELCARLLRGDAASHAASSMAPAPGTNVNQTDMPPGAPSASAADGPNDDQARPHTPSPRSIQIESVEREPATPRGLTVTSIQSSGSKGESSPEITPEGIAAPDQARLQAAQTDSPASGAGSAAVDPPQLSSAQIDLIVQQVLERLTRAAIGDWVRESLPDIAREVVVERIRELEQLDIKES